MCARPGSQGSCNPSEPPHHHHHPAPRSPPPRPPHTPPYFQILMPPHNRRLSRYSTRSPIFRGRSPSKLDMLMRRWLLLICTAAHYFCEGVTKISSVPESLTMQSLALVKTHKGPLRSVKLRPPRVLLSVCRLIYKVVVCVFLLRLNLRRSRSC